MVRCGGEGVRCSMGCVIVQLGRFNDMLSVLGSVLVGVVVPRYMCEEAIVV